MKFFSFFLISLMIIQNASAQNARRDFDSTSMSTIVKVLSKSEKVDVPLNVIKDLKEYALQNNLQEAHVMKNLISVKPLYNKNLNYTEKKLFLEWAIQLYSGENIMIPISYFKEALKKLKTR